MLSNPPPEVEGRVPSEEEMAFKARNGTYYAQDVWRIVREFPSAHIYKCLTDLPNLANKLFPAVRDVGYELEDVSDRMDSVSHALELTMRWAEVVREARTSNKMLIVRRTMSNCGAVLMLQRMEHLRGQCTELSPLALIVLVRDDQVLVTRDRVMDQDSMERMVISMARDKDECCPPAERQERAPNMPAALFKQQMRAMSDMMDKMCRDAAALDEGEDHATTAAADGVEDITSDLARADLAEEE